MHELIVGVPDSLDAIGRGLPAWLWEITLWTGAAWLVARGLDGLLRRHMAPAWRLPLYAVVLVRLLLPLEWQSPLTVLPQPSSSPVVMVSPSLAAPRGDLPLLATDPPARLGAEGLAPIASEPTSDRSIPWGLLVLLAWLAGSTMLLLRLMLHHRGLRRLELAGRPVSIPRVADPGVADPGLQIRVLGHPTAGPLAFGLRRPVIVLPHALLRGDPQILSLVLAHEMAHVRRRDPAVAGLVAIVVALAWPVVPLWLTAARVRTLLELAADERAVARSGGRWREYGRAMIELATERPSLASLPSLALGLFGHVRERIAALRPGPRPQPVVQIAAGIVLPVAMLACAGIPEPELHDADPVARCEAQAAALQAVPSSDAEAHLQALDALVLRFEEARDLGHAESSCHHATRDALVAAATQWHDAAESTHDDRLRVLAGHAYARFIALFPEDPDAHTMRYYYAELMWARASQAHQDARTEDARALFLRSRQEFVEVLDRDPTGRYSQDAAYAQVLATRNALGDPEPPPPTASDESFPWRSYGPRAEALADSYRRYLEHGPATGLELGRVAYDWGRLAMQHNHFEEAGVPLAVALEQLDPLPEGRELAVRSAELEVDRRTIAWTREAPRGGKAARGRTRAR